MFEMYTVEMIASSCNKSALSARPMFNFPDIRCVVTLYNFPRISRQLK